MMMMMMMMQNPLPPCLLVCHLPICQTFCHSSLTETIICAESAQAPVPEVSVQEDDYMSFDEASPVPLFPASMPTTFPARPRPTESVHSPPPEKKAKPLVPVLGALAPPQGKCRGTASQTCLTTLQGRHLLPEREWNYQALSPQPWLRRGFPACFQSLQAGHHAP